MKKRLTHVQVIILGYLIMVLLGTVLLALPVSSADGKSAGLLNSFFTAVSSSCVTGLIRLPTGSSWSLFGQLVLLLLIQIGGLGFMTIATVFFLVINKQMRLSARETMVESLNLTRIDGIARFSGKIVAGTLLFEGSGALLLAIRFIPRFGLWRGLWFSLFHAVSAFCNAGFDLFSGAEAAPSLMLFHDDWLVCLVIIFLIVVGGLGFLVWDDIRRHHFHWKKYSLHTKIVLVSSAVLLLGSALLFLLFDFSSDKPIGTQLLEALFASATARTAGFNTTDTAALSDASKLLTILLMLIGGSPGSTAGGIKTTTIAVLVLSVLAAFRAEKKAAVFGRSIPQETVLKSLSIFFTNLGVSLFAALIICAAEHLAALDVLFETFSAIGTVGMSVGITASLRPFSACLIALLMFMGRVGSVSFSVALLEKRQKLPVSYPEEEITVG
ncbi:MAG: Trk family potassium uptake protein [Lachnospiraceae bacterium]|nr:Trk family potassium uptake protein [Lachnospiraceae bacterium]